jgi:hypothetical protein
VIVVGERGNRKFYIEHLQAGYHLNRLLGARFEVLIRKNAVAVPWGVATVHNHSFLCG